jgi:hypothetical protein
MAKRRVGKAKRVPRPRRPKPRATLKDDKGMPLTSDQKHFTFLPSDFAQAMRPPPWAPTKATRKADPPVPTTVDPRAKRDRADALRRW